MTRPIQLLWDALEQHDCNPRGQDHKFSACCPAHDDSSPSLTCKEGTQGRALTFCWAGCTLDEICAALAIDVRDLFVKEGNQTEWKKTKRRPIKIKLRQPTDPVIHILDMLMAAGLDWYCDHRMGMWRCECPFPHHGVRELSVWLVERSIDSGRENEPPLMYCAHGCKASTILEELATRARETAL